MSALLFKLRIVPDDEAEDIRQLMDKHNIEIYETSAGNWGISMPALWVSKDSDLSRAKSLLNQYQQERAESAQQQYAQNQRSGNAPGLIDKIRQKPLASIAIILFCLFVVYAMVAPFVRLAMQS